MELRSRFALFIFISFSCIFMVTACSSKPIVKRVEVDKTVDLSGRWNDTDSRLVAGEMIADCLNRPWINKFILSHKGRNPDVIVGTVVNRSHEHISIETFTKDLERALINSGRVNFVASKTERRELREERLDMAQNSSIATQKAQGQEAGADLMLKGTINTIIDEIKGEKVAFYQVDLELINLLNNRKVWIGDKKIKKYITRSRFKF